MADAKPRHGLAPERPVLIAMGVVEGMQACMSQTDALLAEVAA